jgi:hypothetical protein
VGVDDAVDEEWALVYARLLGIYTNVFALCGEGMACGNPAHVCGLNRRTWANGGHITNNQHICAVQLNARCPASPVGCGHPFNYICGSNGAWPAPPPRCTRCCGRGCRVTAHAPPVPPNGLTPQRLLDWMALQDQSHLHGCSRPVGHTGECRCGACCQGRCPRHVSTNDGNRLCACALGHGGDHKCEEMVVVACIHGGRGCRRTVTVMCWRVVDNWHCGHCHLCPHDGHNHICNQGARHAPNRHDCPQCIVTNQAISAEITITIGDKHKDDGKEIRVRLPVSPSESLARSR